MDHIKLFDKTKSAFISHQSGTTRRHYTEALKSAAVSLLKYYSPVALANQLNISVKSLQNWQGGCRVASEPATFVPLTLNDDTTSFFPLDTESLVLRLPHQLELILPAKSIKDAVRFISHLIKEMAE